MSLAQGSPRLPSPPPPAEIQIGPKSPGLGSTASRQVQEMEQSIAHANAKRRIHPGTKSEDMAAGPPLVPLGELDSAFQLQEHLAALHYFHSASNTTAITRATAAQLTQPPPGIDRTLWLYELCRFLIAQCNNLIVGFLFDTPPCSSATCPEMRASEWQFLCAVHDQPKSCCAIDYCCHTLDWAANVVTNPKIFPSRFVVLSEGHDKSAVLKNLVNVFRRLHRIFAHAWFQHRGVFWSVEAQTGLYAFFKTVCDMYDLLPAENYKLPPEAEGLEPVPIEKEEKKPIATAIAKPPSQQHENAEHDDDRHSLHARRSNTARHSSRPSTGSAVTTVIEEREDEQDVTSKLKNMHISAPETVEEESEVEVPVIVEGELIDTSPVEVRQPTESQEHQDDLLAHGVKIDVQEDVPVEPETSTTEESTEKKAEEEPKEIPLLDHEQLIEETNEESAPSEEKQPEATEGGPEEVDPAAPEEPAPSVAETVIEVTEEEATLEQFEESDSASVEGVIERAVQTMERLRHRLSLAGDDAADEDDLDYETEMIVRRTREIAERLRSYQGSPDSSESDSPQESIVGEHNGDVSGLDGARESEE
ncbi:Mob1/phocein [Hypoxylon trugodes]|uniref:Mob1/phocein n=1 Tax=Hypoxylon trugodes TaxID=326681 RepID=UPI00219D05DC|nr:Mob1/phocein [Hypoxylon trugodes]KAI1386347.1 Mob1/phocein [Hypoxylon trugodes]